MGEWRVSMGRWLLVKRRLETTRDDDCKPARCHGQGLSQRRKIVKLGRKIVSPSLEIP